jgi:hypothetical protein
MAPVFYATCAHNKSPFLKALDTLISEKYYRTICQRGLGSSVGIATGYGLDASGIEYMRWYYGCKRTIRERIFVKFR